MSSDTTDEPDAASDAGLAAKSRREDAAMPEGGAASRHAFSADASQLQSPDAATDEPAVDACREADACVSESRSAQPALELPFVSEPQRLGLLVGPSRPPSGLTFHGTDLGFPVTLQDEVLLFFGDTTEQPNDLCEEQGNDDMLASIPTRFPGSVPELDVVRTADDPSHFQPLRLLKEGQDLGLNAGRVPVGGFTLGDDVYMLFNRLVLARCDASAETEGCAGNPGFRCVNNIGECTPNRSVVVPPLCDLETGDGCMPEQRCEAASSGFCIDPTSSQFDGSVAGAIAAAVHVLDLGKRRRDEPSVFDQVATFPTSKFQSPSVVQVAAWTGEREDNDFSPGEAALLVWGRPGFTGDGPREAQLYLMAMPLPAASDDTLRWAPSYFAGIDPSDGQPRWSDDQSQAKPLAMDGMLDGDPHEPVTLTQQTSLAFIGHSIQKWVMLYGGDISDLLVQDAAAVRTGPAPGSIVMRVADHPWGPFSPPSPHLLPGSPDQVGDAYGPGGFLYHPECRSTATESCAPANGTINLLDCLQTVALVDPGRMYGAIILPSYTRTNAGGGVDMFWNVSTWNPYSVLMFKTSFGTRTSALR